MTNVEKAIVTTGRDTVKKYFRSITISDTAHMVDNRKITQSNWFAILKKSKVKSAKAGTIYVDKIKIGKFSNINFTNDISLFIGGARFKKYVSEYIIANPEAIIIPSGFSRSGLALYSRLVLITAQIIFKMTEVNTSVT